MATARDGLPESKDMKPETMKARIEAERAKMLYAYGHIDREEAKKKIMPYIEIINARAKALAEDYGVPYRPVSIMGFLR